MINTTITEEVLSLSFNSDSFPMTTGIPLEKIKLMDPKKTDRIREAVRGERIRLVILDGCLPFDLIVEASRAVKDIRREKKLNVVICIVHQEQLLIEGTFWEQNPQNAQKYLERA